MQPVGTVERVKTRTEPAGRPERAIPHGAGLAVLALAGALVGVRRAEAPYADGDVLWGARAGRDLLSTGHVPRVDAYSWSVSGRRWVPNAWGWNVLLGAADRVAGLVGIALLGIASLSLIAVLLGVAARRLGAHTAWTAVLFVITTGFFALFMYPRAQLTDYAGILLVPLLVASAVAGSRAQFLRSGAWLLLTQLVWVNLHSAAVLGPVLVVAAGAGHAARDRTVWRRTSLRVVLLAAGSAAACCATPYGTTLVTHLPDVRRASVGLISEWRPIGLSSPEQILGVVAVLVGFLACCFALRARRYDAVAVLLVLGVATATAIRFAPMVAIAAVPELAAAAGRVRVRPAFLNRICAAALVVFGAASVAGAAGFAQPGAQNASPLVARLPSGCRLLNDLDVGGDVILHRPDVPVYIDSRNDLYGRGFELRSLRQLLDPAVGLAFVRSARVTCVLAPTVTPLVTALRTQPGWQTLGTDGTRTLLVRKAAP
jgi:hypothetical protein